MTEENSETGVKAKSFTTRVPMEIWDKINKYKEYGKWNTNQLMNHALDAFFDIIESDEASPTLPLVCETLKELRVKNRGRLVSETAAKIQATATRREESENTKPEITTELPRREVSDDKPWREQSPQSPEEAGEDSSHPNY